MPTEVGDPPLANQRFARLRASLSAHPASTEVVQFASNPQSQVYRLAQLRPPLWGSPPSQFFIDVTPVSHTQNKDHKLRIIQRK